MAAVSNQTDLASLNDVIYTEFIGASVGLSLARAPVSYHHGVLRVPLMGTNSNVYAHVLRASMAAASAKSEGDEVTATEVTTTESTVSTSMIATAAFVTDEVSQDSLWPALQVAVEEVVWSCAQKIDNDWLALMSAFSTPIGTNATNFDVVNWVTMQTTWTARVESIPDTPLLVLHPDARRDLQTDAITNAASWFGAGAGMQFHDAVKGVNNGRKTNFDGIDIVTASGLPAGDTTGWSNALIVPSGRNAAIAMPFLKPITVELWREPKRLGIWAIASARYGMAEVDDVAGLTCISRT